MRVSSIRLLLRRAAGLARPAFRRGAAGVGAIALVLLSHCPGERRRPDGARPGDEPLRPHRARIREAQQGRGAVRQRHPGHHLRRGGEDEGGAACRRDSVLRIRGAPRPGRHGHAPGADRALSRQRAGGGREGLRRYPAGELDRPSAGSAPGGDRRAGSSRAGGRGEGQARNDPAQVRRGPGREGESGEPSDPDPHRLRTALGRAGPVLGQGQRGADRLRRRPAARPGADRRSARAGRPHVHGGRGRRGSRGPAHARIRLRSERVPRGRGLRARHLEGAGRRPHGAAHAGGADPAEAACERREVDRNAAGRGAAPEPAKDAARDRKAAPTPQEPPPPAQAAGSRRADLSRDLRGVAHRFSLLPAGRRGRVRARRHSDARLPHVRTGLVHRAAAGGRGRTPGSARSSGKAPS